MTASDSPADQPEFAGHRGTRAIQRMVEHAPSTGGLALWVAHQDLSQVDFAELAGVQAAVAATTNVGTPATSATLIATDGNTVFYAPAFDRLALPEQVGLVAHEVLHIALRHPQRYVELQQQVGDVDLQLFNLCADAIVNSALAHLAWLKLPASAMLLDRLLAQVLAIDLAAEAALLDWDVERLYRAIDDRRPPDSSSQQRRIGRQNANQGGAQTGSGRQGAGQQGKSAQGSGQHGDTQQPAGERGKGAGRDQQDSAGSDRGARIDGPRSGRARSLSGGTAIDLLPQGQTRPEPQAEAELAHEWGERVLRAHASDGAHSMLRALLADLPRSHTPWEQLLRTQLTRSLAPRADLSWSRPTRSYLANQGRTGGNKRLPWEPGNSGTKSVPRLVLIVDVSGSIEPALLERFSRETMAILRRLEAGLVLVIGDDRVRRVEQVKPGVIASGRFDLADITFQGGGGTDFTPLLQEADDHRPDIGVVLTDLQGPTRFQPRWPLIWAVPEAWAAAVQPFGRKIVLR
jgi:predicted metal-dependent peptidase